MKDYLVISTSLNPDSNSRVLARCAFAHLKDTNAVEWIDLADWPLPQCDGASCYEDPNVKELTRKIKQAKCVLMAVPIYNYAVAATAKNLIELTGDGWNDKVVGFLCAAGGRMSYMAVMSLANSLMLDFRCLIIPRFVYADGACFNAGSISDSVIEERVADLVKAALGLSRLASVAN